MTATATLARVRAAGGEAVIRDGRLLLRAPRPLPEALVAEVRTYKSDLLALLAANDMPPPALLPASPEQAAAERQDRAAVAAEPPPLATAAVPPALLAEWTAALAALLAVGPQCQLITDPEAAGRYFRAEARRRLGLVQHDQHAAGLLLAFWRHARGGAL